MVEDPSNSKAERKLPSCTWWYKGRGGGASLVLVPESQENSRRATYITAYFYTVSADDVSEHFSLRQSTSEAGQ